MGKSFFKKTLIEWYCDLILFLISLTIVGVVMLTKLVKIVMDKFRVDRL